MGRRSWAARFPDRRSIAVAVAGFSTFTNLYPPQAILPELAQEFGASRAQTAFTITAPLLAVACVAPFVGAISDRIGRKGIMVAACLALVVPTLLIAFTTSLAQMVALRFLQGLTLPFIFAVTVAYIGDECEGHAAIRSAGIYTLGTIFGGFFGRFEVGVATDLGSWRAGFAILAALTLMGGVFVALFLPHERRFTPVRGGLRATLGTYAEHLTNPRMLATCGVGAGMLFSVVGTFTAANFYLADPPFRLTPSQLSMVFVVYLVALITTPAATRLAVRIGRRPTLAAAVAIAMAGLPLTLLPSVPAAVAGLGFLIAMMFVVQTLSLGFIGAAVRHAKSTAVGLYVTIYYAGGAFGGMLPPFVWRAAGWPGVVALIEAVMLGMAVLGATFWREHPEP
jgi:MFS transporter, YNFM family, putative membrane transport protein